MNTTATVWLGTTLGCAQCHNHKYDPFTQKDFYPHARVLRQRRLLGVRRRAAITTFQNPALDLPTPEQAAQRKVCRRSSTSSKRRCSAQSPERTEQQAAWERRFARQTTLDRSDAARRRAPTSGRSLTTLPTDPSCASAAVPLNDTYVVNATLPLHRDHRRSGWRRCLTKPCRRAARPRLLRQLRAHRIHRRGRVLTIGRGAGAPLVLEKANDNSHVGGNEANQLVTPDAETKNTRDVPPGWSINATNDVVRHAARGGVQAEDAARSAHGRRSRHA